MDLSQFRNATLVPVDFTDNSMLALEHAGVIANLVEHEQHKIVLLHVMEGSDLDDPYTPGSSLPDDNRISLMIEGAENRLKKIIKEKLSNKNVTVNYMIAGGKVYRQIAKVAEMIDATYIVMGTHGASGFQGFLGSNAARVSQVAPCPTVVVREKNLGEGYKNIVLPLDLTKETKQKVTWAAQVAQYFHSTVHIVSFTEEDEFLAHRIKNNIQQVESYLKQLKVATTSTYLTDVPDNFAASTIDFAKEKNADMIIIMTQQEKSIKEYLFGSYAQQIVTKSNIPVMTINPRAELKGKFEVNT